MKAIKRIEITFNGKVLHLVLGKQVAEWIMGGYYKEDCWHFSLEDILGEAIDVDEDTWYWLIGGRCYETTESV